MTPFSCHRCLVFTTPCCSELNGIIHRVTTLGYGKQVRHNSDDAGLFVCFWVFFFFVDGEGRRLGENDYLAGNQQRKNNINGTAS